MTSLAYPERPARPAARGSLTHLDRIVLAVVALAIGAALALAGATILGDNAADLPSLIPFDQPAALSNFTA
jgi:hypothetical protein